MLQAVLSRYGVSDAAFGPVCIIVDKLDKLPAEQVLPTTLHDYVHGELQTCLLGELHQHLLICAVGQVQSRKVHVRHLTIVGKQADPCW